MIFRALTLQEANLLLPLVQERFTRIHSLIADGQRLSELYQNLGASEQAVAVGEGVVGASPDQTKKMRLIKRKLKKVESQIRTQIADVQLLGVVVKSIFPARVDFLAERHKQPVYLCWQAGDSEVSHWHPIDEGFSTRRLIDEKKAFGPMVVH